MVDETLQVPGCVWECLGPSPEAGREGLRCWRCGGGVGYLHYYVEQLQEEVSRVSSVREHQKDSIFSDPALQDLWTSAVVG